MGPRLTSKELEIIKKELPKIFYGRTSLSRDVFYRHLFSLGALGEDEEFSGEKEKLLERRFQGLMMNTRIVTYNSQGSSKYAPK